MTEMLDDGPVRENIVSGIVLEGRPLYKAYSALCSGVWYASLVLAALGACAAVKRRGHGAAIVAIAALGMLLFLLLWEARSRYMFSFVPVVLLLASMGIEKEKGEKICTIARNLWKRRAGTTCC
jgi:CHASE2 domain-containing sensor protein